MSVLFWTSYAALWVVVAIQVVLVLALARLVGQLQRRVPPAGARVIDPGPEPGTRVQDWELEGRVYAFPRPRGLLLLYLSPHCRVCRALIPAASRFVDEIRDDAEALWVLTEAHEETRERYVREHRLSPAASEDRLPPVLRVSGAPFAVWIDADGVVRAKGMVNNREHLESLRSAFETGHASFDTYVAAMQEEQS